jgi:hypothetical protein
MSEITYGRTTILNSKTHERLSYMDTFQHHVCWWNGLIESVHELNLIMWIINKNAMDE